MTDAIEDIIGDYRAFAAQQRDRLLARGIDIAPYELSHIACRVPEWDQYLRVRTQLEGPTGPIGPSTVYRVSPADVNLPGGGGAIAASLSLPAGAYAVTATAQLGHSESTFQPVLCRVQLGSEPGSQHGTILQAAFTGNVYTVPLTLSQAGQLTGPGTAQLICLNNSGDGTDVVKVDRILLWAVRVENLVTQ
jgi:hypothetical protein